MSPTKKDFEHLVAFLLRQLDPHWRLLGKLEDEVPAMLAWLKYPFQVRSGDACAACRPELCLDAGHARLAECDLQHVNSKSRDGHRSANL